MGRPEAPILVEGPIGEFADGLRGLRRAAGAPSYRVMARQSSYSAAALSVAANGRDLPSWQVTEAYVRACGGKVADWRVRWEGARAAGERARLAAHPTSGPQLSASASLVRSPIRFRVLGPLRIDSARGGVGATGSMTPKTRLLLAILLLHANTHVSTQSIVDVLWSDDPPGSADRMIPAYVSRLRRTLAELPEENVLEASRGGYRLNLAPGALDLQVFEGALDDARRQRADGHLASAAATLKRGLELWTGEPLVDVLDSEVIEAYRIRLAERRMMTAKELAKLQLESGERTEALVSLASLVASHPFDEELLALRMTALHQSGRTADALAAYQEFRRLLRTELGIDPSRLSEELHRKILSNDLDLYASVVVENPPQLTVRPAELPPVTPRLYGRDSDLLALDSLARADNKVVIIAGMPGVGKTALAVHWAQANREAFPDGQLYVHFSRQQNGRGHTDAGSALTGLLASLGVPYARIPVDVVAKEALYRTLLADRRILLILDDAQSADQVVPLLPGTPSCMTLITARTRLSEVAVRVGAGALILAPLDEQGGLALLTELLGSGRVAEQSDEAAEVARMCGGLPLALRIAGTALQLRPTLHLTTLASRLSEGRLDELRAGELTMRRVLEEAYRALPEDAARLFQLIAAHPVRSLDAAAVAKLADVDPTDAEVVLSALLEANMIFEVSPGLYKCHDLLRALVQDGRMYLW